MSSASSLEIPCSMEDHYMQSLTTIRESTHGTSKMTSGDSSSVLTTLTGSNLHLSLSVTYPSPLRLCATVKPLASSSNTRKRYARSKYACGKPASTKTQVGVDWKELTHYTGLKRHWWTWIIGQGYVMGTQDIGNMGVPPEKGVMLWDDVWTLTTRL